MPTYNYELKIKKSYGGRSNAYTWVNSYNIQSELALGETGLRSMMYHVVAAERTAHLDLVHFMRATLSELMQTPTQQGQDTHVGIELEGVGARASSGTVLPDNIVLEVKRDAVTGRNGVMHYRGCLMDSDIEAAEDHTYILANPTPFTTGGSGADSLIEMLNVDFEAWKFVMPNKPLDFFDVNRDVLYHRLGGVAFRQVTNPRRSSVAAITDGATREVSRLQKNIVSILKGGPFSALNPIHAQAAISAAKKIKEILEAIPPEKALKISLDAALKQIPGGPEV